jgi:hypothetical protein
LLKKFGINLWLNQRRKIVLQINDCRWLPALIIFSMLVIANCAATAPGKSAKTVAPPPAEIATLQGWWHARFRMAWPQAAEPSWHIDLLIAHKIVAPVLEQYKDDIQLWRFHRRAARDTAGHQFSFIFYASAETAHQVFDTLGSNVLLNEMKFAGLLIEDAYDNPDRIIKPQIKDSSDPHWPSTIQKSWPYFIEGVSQMWLNLITETVAQMPNASAPLSLQETDELYKEVNETITVLWAQEGRHAFLHHLSAVFGYQPVIFYEKRMLNF